MTCGEWVGFNKVKVQTGVLHMRALQQSPQQEDNVGRQVSERAPAQGLRWGKATLIYWLREGLGMLGSWKTA